MTKAIYDSMLFAMINGETLNLPLGRKVDKTIPQITGAESKFIATQRKVNKTLKV